MPNSIMPEELNGELENTLIVDVRKIPAKQEFSNQIPGASLEDPAKIEEWFNEYLGQNVVVYCVHGHEVSQDACSFLSNHGGVCRYLKGGLAGWVDAGFEIQPIGGE